MSFIQLVLLGVRLDQVSTWSWAVSEWGAGGM